MVPFVRTLGLDRDVLDHIRVQAEPPNISPAGSKPIGEQRHHYFFMALAATVQTAEIRGF